MAGVGLVTSLCAVVLGGDLLDVLGLVQACLTRSFLGDLPIPAPLEVAEGGRSAGQSQPGSQHVVSPWPASSFEVPALGRG